MVQSEPTHYLFPIALIILGLVVGVMIWSQSGPAPAVSPVGQLFEVSPGGLPPLGRADAPVKVVEFGDYACSFCGQYFKETLSKIRDEFTQAGQVQWYWRDFATLDPQSVPAARAARCAAEQNAFWPYRDGLFGNGIGDSRLTALAEEIGLGLEDFEECLTAAQPLVFVEQDAKAARELGVQAVPTFFVNGERIAGAQPEEVLRAAIARHLK